MIETDAFGAFGVVLAEYGLQDRVRDINLAAARIARQAADDASPPPTGPAGWPGTWDRGPAFPPSARSPTSTLRDSYEEQATALLAGGVDILIIETVFDLLQAKAAMNACTRAMVAAGRRVPLQVQVTIELTGRMLPGTEIGAALAALEAMRPDVIGLNCATGPAEMGEAVRHLSQHCRVPVAVQPNAGLPTVVDGAMHYDLTPEALADHLERFVSELGVSVIGGCCGTTPEHLRAVVERCRDLTPADAPSRARAGRRLHLQRRPLPPGHLVSRRRASAPTPTGRRSSATPCWRPTGTRPWSWPATRSKRAPTSSTSASTTPVPTACPT